MYAELLNPAKGFCAHFTFAGFDVLNDVEESLPSRFASVKKIVVRAVASPT
jgi:hypothetical protein